MMSVIVTSSIFSSDYSIPAGDRRRLRRTDDDSRLPEDGGRLRRCGGTHRIRVTPERRLLRLRHCAADDIAVVALLPEELPHFVMGDVLTIEQTVTRTLRRMVMR